MKQDIKFCIHPLCKGRHKVKKLDSLINSKIAHFNDDIKITDEGSICEENRGEFIHMLRKRVVGDDLKDYELLDNTLCKSILQNFKSNISSEFTFQELGDVLRELKRGKCIMGPAGFKGEIFMNGKKGGGGGADADQSLLAMANSIKE